MARGADDACVMTQTRKLAGPPRAATPPPWCALSRSVARVLRRGLPGRSGARRRRSRRLARRRIARHHQMVLELREGARGERLEIRVLRSLGEVAELGDVLLVVLHHLHGVN